MQASGATSAARILLAEDNPVNQKVAVAMLRRLGHLVEVVPNGAEAVAAVGRAAFDLVFMDCQMPHMDGYEATILIREAEAAAGRIPIIAMTANALSGDREQCLAAGMDDYLTKPIDPEKLAAALGRWLPVLAASPAAMASSATGFAPSPSTDAYRGSVVATVDPGETAVEISRLKGVVGDDETVLREYLQLFVSIVDGLVQQLADAIGSADAKTTRRFAHQIKGSAASIGADALASIAGEIEKHASTGATDGAAERFARLTPAYGRVVAFIRAY